MVEVVRKVAEIVRKVMEVVPKVVEVVPKVMLFIAGGSEWCAICVMSSGIML